MKITKLQVAAIIFTLVASTGAYAVGRGIDVRQAVIESRCSAGAFIAHSDEPSRVMADSHSSTSAQSSGASAQAPAAQYSTSELGATILPNGNLEEVANGRPAGWDNNVAGHNDGHFSLVAGQNSATAIRTEISKYTDGTAGWFGPAIAVTPNGYYQFQDVYRSDVPTRAELMLRDQSGKSQYLSLDVTPASAGWTTYTQRFFVPANVSQIMIYHPLDRAGWLETDNFTLQTATPAAFGEGMVSVTFDDGWRNIHDNALPLMEKYEVVSTQYIVSGFLGQMREYMSPGQVYDFVSAGHEVASHSVDHADLTKLSDKDLASQLELSDAGLSKCYGEVTDFAPPFGAGNAHTTQVAQKNYQTSRSVMVGYNSPDAFNPYLLKVQNVRADTSASQLKAWLDTAQANHVWLILVYHQVSEGGGEYTRTPTNFENDLMAIKASGLNVKTVHDAYLATQK